MSDMSQVQLEASTSDEPGMRIELQVHGRKIVVPCGSGRQSVKWLAMVAAQRYQMLLQTGGRSRQREPSLAPEGAFLPRNVCWVCRHCLNKHALKGDQAGQDGMIDPKTSIRDAVAASGKSVSDIKIAVELGQVIPADLRSLLEC